jgi:hypothetical protein
LDCPFMAKQNPGLWQSEPLLHPIIYVFSP